MSNTDEIFDESLEGMIRSRDDEKKLSEGASRRVITKSIQPKITVEPAETTDTNRVPVSEKPQGSQPVEFVSKETTWATSLKRCAKYVVLFGGLSILIFYWQQTGQMAASAAVPSAYVCALLAGLSVGRGFKK